MHITIPTRVGQAIDKAKTEQAKRHIALTYIMGMIAAHYTERQSLRAVAEAIGMDHSTISLYIRNGAFSEAAAERIATTFDKNLKKAILNPLAVPRKG